VVPQPDHPADRHLYRRDRLVADGPLPSPLHPRARIGDPKEAALWAGVVMGVSLAISCAMTPVWAALADRFGGKLILLRALVALAATNFAVGLVGLWNRS